MNEGTPRGPALALAVLALAPVLAHAEIVLRASGRELRPDVRLDVALEGATVDPTLGWRRDGEAAIGSARTPAFTATIRLAPARPGAVALELAIDYAADVSIDREVVRLRLPGAASAIGRDLRFAPLAGPLRVDRGTPVLVATREVALVGEDGVTGARYEPHGGGVDVALVLDDRAAHPFAVYDRCLDRLPTPTDWAALERRHPLDRLHRRAGAHVVARATLYVLEDTREPLPLVVERWPRGTEGAVVFTDHADRTDPDALRAVLYGTSRDGGAPGRGLLGHGLRMTKTFFARGGRGTLGDDPAARALADVLVAAGSEVGSHSITAHADPRERVASELGVLAPWRPSTWIDHEPYTNCEAVSTLGWDDRPPWGVRDLLVDEGYRWVWAATDVKTGEIDLFAGESPVVFPLPVDPRLWVFRSTWLGVPPAELAHALGDVALEELERRRGLAVLHTYLSASPATTPSAEHRRALAVRQAADGSLELDPRVEATFERLASHAAGGRLLVAPWREVGDRLRALGHVLVRYDRDGAATIENAGAEDLSGLAVSVPRRDVVLAVDGCEAHAIAGADDHSAVWLDLPAGGRARVRAPVPFLPLANVVVEVR